MLEFTKTYVENFAGSKYPIETENLADEVIENFKISKKSAFSTATKLLNDLVSNNVIF